MTDDVLKSDLILKQIEQSGFAEKVVEVDEETMGLLIVQLGERLFALPGSEAREIMPFSASTWIPGATAILPGVMNIRGDVAAVIDVKKVLTVPEAGSGAGCFFVLLRHGDGRSGLLVDDIVDVIELSVAENMPLLSSLDVGWQRFAASQFDYQGRIVTVLKVEQLIEAVRL
ncbi:chemotaxis protein CheW [Azotosporobacter soli]|uniref:chemotaxis protein CheW n=1 Tax=Azotosporobacter soli TaxID=3055040 RepID=UPI0031FEC649